MPCWRTPVTPITEPVRWAFLTGVQLMQAGRASLLLREGASPVLVVAASVGIDTAVVPTIRVALGEGIAGIVAERGAHFFGASGDTTFLSMPVHSENGLVGVLNLTNRVGGSQFGEEHIAQARALAAHIGNLLAYDRHAVYDSLSGLQNERGFEEFLRRELARSKRLGRPFAVVTMRVRTEPGGADAFESLIRAMGEAIQASLRRYDGASHLGGGVFALLLAVPHENVHAIGARISQVLTGVARSVHCEALVDIGIARCPDDALNARDLMAVARRGMDERGAKDEVPQDGPGMVS